MGTEIPPKHKVATSVIVHSGLFSERIISLSPAFKPRVFKPSEKLITVSPNSSVEIGI